MESLNEIKEYLDNERGQSNLSPQAYFVLSNLVQQALGERTELLNIQQAELTDLRQQIGCRLDANVVLSHAVNLQAELATLKAQVREYCSKCNNSNNGSWCSICCPLGKREVTHD